MNQYTKSEWKKFRDELIELDNYKCRECKRSNSEVILQVHHKRYIPGHLPWQYPLEDCETLCKYCHAVKHQIIRPSTGWEFITQEDLGDLNGTCQNCNTTIRHMFLIQHKDWGTMEVGTNCCDKLTDTILASNLVESQTSYLNRKKRFLNSIRWKQDKNIYFISQGSFEIQIQEKDKDIFVLTIHNIQGKNLYYSLNEAKEKAFDVIESNTLLNYLKKHNIPFKDKKQKKKSNIKKVS